MEKKYFLFKRPKREYKEGDENEMKLCFKLLGIEHPLLRKLE